MNVRRTTYIAPRVFDKRYETLPSPLGKGDRVAVERDTIAVKDNESKMVVRAFATVSIPFFAHLKNLRTLRSLRTLSNLSVGLAETFRTFSNLSAVRVKPQTLNQKPKTQNPFFPQ